MGLKSWLSGALKGVFVYLLLVLLVNVIIFLIGCNRDLCDSKKLIVLNPGKYFSNIFADVTLTIIFFSLILIAAIVGAGIRILHDWRMEKNRKSYNKKISSVISILNK